MSPERHPWTLCLLKHLKYEKVTHTAAMYAISNTPNMAAWTWPHDECLMATMDRCTILCHSTVAHRPNNSMCWTTKRIRIQIWISRMQFKFQVKNGFHIPSYGYGRNTFCCGFSHGSELHCVGVRKKRDQNVFCNISYKTRPTVMKFGT